MASLNGRTFSAVLQRGVPLHTVPELEGATLMLSLPWISPGLDGTNVGYLA